MTPLTVVEAAPVKTAPKLATVVPLVAEVTQKIKQDLRMGREHQQGRINWITTIAMGLFHVGAIAALFFFSWTNLAVFFVMYFLAINVGIGMAYHRLLTHRGYKTPKWVEYFVTICGCLALEGGPIFWVATHRVHHQNSDQEGDPHTPHDGTWWAHAGWILSGRAMHSETALLGRYAPDLTRDRVHVWLSKYHYLPLVVTGLAQLALGAALDPRHHRPARNVARQLRHPPLGQAPLRDQGRLPQQLVGSHPHRRRRLAQQPPRPPRQRAPRPRLVRVRRQLLRHLATRKARARKESSDREVRSSCPQASRRLHGVISAASPFVLSIAGAEFTLRLLSLSLLSLSLPSLSLPSLSPIQAAAVLRRGHQIRRSIHL